MNGGTNHSNTFIFYAIQITLLHIKHLIIYLAIFELLDYIYLVLLVFDVFNMYLKCRKK